MVTPEDLADATEYVDLVADIKGECATKYGKLEEIVVPRPGGKSCCLFCVPDFFFRHVKYNM